jgi:hypothetical protein
MILKTGACFTAELELNCPTIVGCVTALPVGPAAVAGTTQVLGKDGQYHALPAAPVVGPVQDPYATPAETIAGTATALIVNPADLVARENIPAQTGLSNNVSAIPAPAANQSPWGQNLLGETLHYAPGLGWKIVDDRYGAFVPCAGGVALANNAFNPAVSSFTAPRAGVITVSAEANVSLNAGWDNAYLDLFKNGVIITNHPTHKLLPADSGTATTTAVAASVARIVVAAGDVITSSIQIGGTSTSGTSTASTFRGLRVQYVN